MTTMSGYTRSQRPRQAILGQLPRIHRADGSPIRVLLVDDEPALTNLVKMALHYEGWDVEVAHDGQEAIAKFDKVGPDVLVLDIMLPDVDGLEILRRVRESDVYTPTLFLTARDSVMDRVTGLTSGADDYMTKPFTQAFPLGADVHFARLAATRWRMPATPTRVGESGIRWSAGCTPARSVRARAGIPGPVRFPSAVPPTPPWMPCPGLQSRASPGLRSFR